MMVQYSFHPDGAILGYTKAFAYSPEHHSCIWQHGKPNPFARRSLWQEHDAAGSSPFSLRLSVCDHSKTAVFSMHLGRDITVADAAPTHAVCRGPIRQSTHDKENSRRVDESILPRRIGADIQIVSCGPSVSQSAGFCDPQTSNVRYGGFIK